MFRLSLPRFALFLLLVNTAHCIRFRLVVNASDATNAAPDTDATLDATLETGSEMGPDASTEASLDTRPEVFMDRVMPDRVDVRMDQAPPTDTPEVLTDTVDAADTVDVMDVVDAADVIDVVDATDVIDVLDTSPPDVIDVVRPDVPPASDAPPVVTPMCEMRFTADSMNCGMAGRMCRSDEVCRACLCRPTVAISARLNTGTSVILSSAMGTDRRTYLLAKIVRAFSFAGTPINASASMAQYVIFAFENDGTPRWARILGQTPEPTGAGQLAVSPEGNVFFAVQFTGNLCLDGVCATALSPTISDVFVGSVNADNVPRFVDRFGGPFADFSAGLAVLGSDDYAVAVMSSTTNTDAGMGTSSLDTRITRRNAMGGGWTRDLNAPTGNELNRHLAMSSDGTVTIAGIFTGSSSLGGGPMPLTAQRADAYVTRFGNDGRFLWTRVLSTAGDEEVAGLGVDAMGLTHVLLNFSDNLMVGAMNHPNRGMDDIALVVLDNNGVPRRSHAWGSAAADTAETLFVLPDGTDLIGASFTTALDPGAGLLTPAATDSYLAHYNTSGMPVWVRQLTGTANERIRSVVWQPDRLVFAAAADNPLAYFGTEQLNGVGQGFIFARVNF